MRRLSTTIRTISSVLLLSITLCGTSAAQTAGDPLDAGAKADAEAAGFFTKGKAAFTAQKYDDAYRAFQEAWARKKTYDIAGNLAQVELKLGKLRDAAEHLQHAVKNFPLSGDQNQKAVMQKHLEQARGKFHALTLDIPIPGAQIYIDGILVGTAPHDPFFLDAGTVDKPLRQTIEVKHPGYEVWRGGTVSLAGSQEYKRVDLKPIAEAPSKPVAAVPPVPLDSPKEAEQPQTPQEESKLPVRKIVLGVGGAVTLIGIGAGIGTIVAASGKHAEANRIGEELQTSDGAYPCGAGQPSRNDSACNNIAMLDEQRRTFRGVAIATFILGGAAAVGTGLYAFWPRKASSSQSASATPLLGPGWVGVGGNF
jgi:tetratricopeptide (TPR) repeat protein